ncbi:MAG: hypothetical protein IJ581_03135 [Paludibacteraceae bacterium]|nr:hypothetical protein [Paludibacteraceae bacterium]
MKRMYKTPKTKTSGSLQPTQVLCTSAGAAAPNKKIEVVPAGTNTPTQFQNALAD